MLLLCIVVLRQIGDRVFASLRSASESAVEFGDLLAMAVAQGNSVGVLVGTLRFSGSFHSYAGKCSTFRIRFIQTLQYSKISFCELYVDEPAEA